MTALPVLFAAAFSCAMERVDSMDPARAQSAYDSRAVRLVYETPLEIDYRARPYRLRPGICELPEKSADGLVWTYRVREGSGLDASDVRRAMDRLRDPDNPSPGSWTMKRVAALETPDEKTLVVRLSRPQHVFPWMTSMAYCAVPAKDGGGTGPYRLKSWWRNHEMVFERNPAWRGWADTAERDAAEGLRPFDTVRYLVVDDPSTRWLMFLKGELDCLETVSRDNWSAVADSGGNIDPALATAGMHLHRGGPALEMRYIGMNMRDATLGKNRKLRQALSCAFDFPAWKRFYNGTIDRADGPVPPSAHGCIGEPSPYAWNPEKAARLMAEAGYPGGIDPATGRRLELTLSIGRPTQDSREAGELVAGFFARIGVKLNLDFLTWEAFLGAISRGDAQMFLLAWLGDYPDAENFLQLFHSANASPGPNHSCYANPEFDAEYDAAMAAATEEERDAHWRRCQEIVREDCPWIFTHVTQNLSLSGPRVLEYVPGDFMQGFEKHLRTKE